MNGCVFCKIINGEIPAEKIMEDEKHLAFLSINPVYQGLTVVTTKKHFGSYAYQSMPDEDLANIHIFAKKVALLLDKALGSERCVQIMEGLEVDHVHLKLFPKYKGVHGAIEEKETAEDPENLRKVADKIRSQI